jgi:probable H4MPT-linked C1 transfer pathway protein
MIVLGWDIGGAHLKLAQIHDGGVAAIRIEPCPLWQGMAHLRSAMDRALEGQPVADRHAVTMTGELTDLFADRAEGVRAIIEAVGGRLGEATLDIYATDGGFLAAAAARAAPDRVASANWHATAALAARLLGDGLLVDIGSTTTDLVPFSGGKIAARGYDDAARLVAGELVYTGIVRTPVMAMARTLPFAGAEIGVMAEYFATSGDVHRLTRALPEGADLHPTADNRGKSLAESRARLARMIGRDAASAPEEAWEALAFALTGRQLFQLECAAERVLSAVALSADAPLVGAGVGRFLALELARRLRRPYRDFASLVAVPEALAAASSDAAPAVAVALLRALA